MGNSASKIDAQTITQNREDLAAVKQDIADMNGRMQTEREHSKRKIKAHQESVDASLRSINKKIEVVHEQLQAHESTTAKTSAELRTDVNGLEDKVRILKLETEKAKVELKKTDSELKKLQLEMERENKKAEEQRRKTDSELKKIQLEMKQENTKSNNELEKLKLVLRHQQGKMQHQREMKELERESKNEMQMTVDRIKELQDSLSPEQFNVVLKIMIPAPLPSPAMPDEVDKEFPIGTEELDREEDSFVGSPRSNYPSNWPRRPHTEIIRPHHSHTAPLFL